MTKTEPYRVGDEVIIGSGHQSWLIQSIDGDTFTAVSTLAHASGGNRTRTFAISRIKCKVRQG